MSPKQVRTLSVLTLSLVLAAPASLGQSPAATDPAAILRDEYTSMQTELSTEMNKERARLASLEGDYKSVVTRTKERANAETQGIALLDRYALLLKNRYTNDKGLADPSLEISTADAENINKIFISYLNTKPLVGKVSLSQGLEVLERGKSDIKDLVKLHSDPDDKNTSELQILRAKIEQSMAQIKVLEKKFEILGLNQAPAPVAPGPAASGAAGPRAPASNGSR